jgi:hypothetical protein
MNLAKLRHRTNKYRDLQHALHTLNLLIEQTPINYKLLCDAT